MPPSESGAGRLGRFSLLVPTVLSLVLTLSVLESFLLFHTLAELFAITVAVLAGVVGWHTYLYSRNNFLMLLAIGYFWVGGLDLAHTLAYKGMTVYPFGTADEATQLWLAARFMEAGVLLIAPAYLRRPLNPRAWTLGLGLIAALLYALIRSGHFPHAYLEGTGLTGFKIASEYLIVVLLGGALWHLWAHRRWLDADILQLVTLSIVFTIAAELAFTLYRSVYGVENFVGHLLKLFSFWFVFVAIVRTTLAEPFRSLARDADSYEAIPDATVVVDRNGVILRTNRAARAVTGLSDDELLARHCHGLLHPRALSEAECPVCRAVRAGEPLSRLELEYPERARWYQISLAPLSAAKAPTGVVHVLRDVTGDRARDAALHESHERLSGILNAVGEGIYGIDADNRGIFVNLAFERLTGWSAEEVHGEPLHALIHHTRPDGSPHPASECPVHRSIREGKVYESGEDMFWRKDGTGFPVEFTTAAMRDPGGRVVGGVVVFRDISARKQAERALYESERRYRAIMESAGDAILIAGEDGRFLDANRRATDLLGYSKRELLTMHPRDIHPPEQMERLQAAFAQMRERGFSLDEFSVVRNDGSTAPVEVAGTRIRIGDETVFLGTFRDISERRRLDEERSRYREDLEHTVAARTEALTAANRELESFSYSVSHDLRAPLRAINGFSLALTEDCGAALDADCRDYLARISAASTRMGQLIDGLLTISRVGRREINRSYVDLSQAATEVARELREADPQRSVEFAIAPGLAAEGDPALLRVVLDNLCGNAWKFTAGRADARIEVGARDEPEGRVFFVRDNGVGFDPQQARGLFQPFQRLHGDSFEGTGIGLATVQRIVRRHGGRVWAESAPGEGATFFFTLH